MNASIRHAVHTRCDGNCEDCGERRRLTMHHLHYDTVGQESEDDIAGLCWDCHQARHRDLNGDFWRDPQEQEAYWFTFCEELQRA